MERNPEAPDADSVEAPNRNVLRAEATRKALLAAARELFAERGFAATNTDQIVKKAGLTRGALYHHYKDKRDLFRALREQIAEELADHVRDESRRAKSEGPTARLFAGVRSFLDGLQDPAVHRLLLIESPAVEGADAWRRGRGDRFLRYVESQLRNTMAAGQIEEQPIEPLASLLLAALWEGGLYVARSDDAERAQAEVITAVGRLWGGLRAGARRGA